MEIHFFGFGGGGWIKRIRNRIQTGVRFTLAQTSNLLSKHWNSFSLSLKPSAKAPPDGGQDKTENIATEDVKVNVKFDKIHSLAT